MRVEIDRIIRYLKDTGLYPDVRTIDGISSDPEVIINGKKILSLCSANYLGLANNETLKNSVIKGIKKYGLHPTGARLVSGTLDVHLELEKVTAELKETEDSMTFNTGVLANIGVIPALINLPALMPTKASMTIIRRLFNTEAAIFSDELNHGSIVDGCRLARAKIVIYRHCDMDDLEKKLRSSRAKRKLVVTDGVFSMDGDVAPMPQIINLSKKYGAMLMVDDAHATGVLGENGKGTLEYFGLHSGVDVQMGTYSKAFGLSGGFIAGDKELIDFLRVMARTYVFSGAIWGSIAYGVLKAMDIVKNGKERRHKLWHNSDYLRNELKKRGFDTLTSKDTPIIPILIGEEGKAIEVARELFNNRILAPCIRWPAVPKKKSRIRISLMSTHTKEQLDYFIDVMEHINAKSDIVK